MKSDTQKYIQLQRLYKARAEEEKQAFKSYLRVPVNDTVVDSFVKNAHALVVLRGKTWGAFDEDKAALGNTLGTVHWISGVIVDDAEGDEHTSSPFCSFVTSSK
jgi:amyloid beta precursor protein binding protein 1